jgi:hypothetical protein
MFESTRIFLELIIFSRVAYWLAKSGYNTFKKSRISMDVEERKGTDKKFPGVENIFYSALLCIVSLFYIKTILEMGKEKILDILFFASPDPGFGIGMIGVAIVLYFIQMSRANSRPANIPINESGYKSFKIMKLYFLIIGVEFAFGFPYWIFIGTFAYIIYFSPLLSEIDKSEQFKKSYSKKVSEFGAEK